MTGAMPPLWVIAPPGGMTKAKLADLWRMVPEQYRGSEAPLPAPETCADLRAALEDARQRYRIRSRLAAGSERAARGRPGITAAEADAWLRSLPPLPFGDV